MSRDQFVEGGQDRRPVLARKATTLGLLVEAHSRVSETARMEPRAKVVDGTPSPTVGLLVEHLQGGGEGSREEVPPVRTVQILDERHRWPRCAYVAPMQGVKDGQSEVESQGGDGVAGPLAVIDGSA